jgi:hypothetical protein
MILMHWRTLGESELCENHKAWRIMSSALWLASILMSCVSVGTGTAGVDKWGGGVCGGGSES